MFQIEYIYYIVVLLILSGIYSLGIDMRTYKKKEMKKEKKFAGFLGWLNVTIGVLLLTINWVYQNWLW